MKVQKPGLRAADGGSSGGHYGFGSRPLPEPKIAAKIDPEKALPFKQRTDWWKFYHRRDISLRGALKTLIGAAIHTSCPCDQYGYEIRTDCE